MKRFALFPLLLIATLTTGASFIDQETKTNVEQLKVKIEELATQVKEQSIIEKKLLENLDRQGGIDPRLIEELKKIQASQEKLLQSRPAVVQTQPGSVTLPPELLEGQKALEEGIKPLAEVIPLINKLLEEVGKIPERTTSSIKFPEPSTAPTPIIAERDWSNEFSLLERQNRLAVILSILALIALATLVFVIRFNDRRLHQKFRDLEVNMLQSQTASIKKGRKKGIAKKAEGRPHLKVFPEDGRILLTNVGEIPADEIRLTMGPAPATMKERHRVDGELQTGEEAVLDLQQWDSDTLFGSLEYKNPLNGKFYKDQFTLHYDPQEKRFLPEAS